MINPGLPQSDAKGLKNIKPFLVLNGHGSRLQMPFLRYINTREDQWVVVCIGVPYGTALCQVQDLEEQNGSHEGKTAIAPVLRKYVFLESMYPQISFLSLTKLEIRAMAK